jgi:dihydroxy-acid dehydratase
VSDGIQMELTGCVFFSFRDVIADSMRDSYGAQWYDGLIAVPGCDKKYAGICNEAMGRLKP